jgi:hypothetical protein
MLRSLLVIAFCLFPLATNAAAIQINSKESIEDFAARFAPNDASEVVHVASASVWGLAKPVIVAFYQVAESNDVGTPKDVLGVIFVPINSNQYERFKIDVYGPEGVAAQINSVFFAKTDKTSDAKLFVLVSWPANNGALYETLIYEKPEKNSKENMLIRFNKFNNTFGVECDYCPSSDHPDKAAKYKTAADVKAELKKLIK